MSSTVVFRRVNGRIIPIRQKKQDNTAIVAGSATVVAAAGTAIAAARTNVKAKQAFAAYKSAGNMAVKSRWQSYKIGYNFMGQKQLRSYLKLSRKSKILRGGSKMLLGAGLGLLAYGALKNRARSGN